MATRVRPPLDPLSSAPGITVIPGDLEAQVVAGRSGMPGGFLKGANAGIAAGLVFLLGQVSRYRDAVFAAITSLIVYAPSLAAGSSRAGYLYTGDVVGYYWPMVVKLRAFLSRGQFVALDYSQYDASSEFFLIPNFFACHPLFTAWSLGVPTGGDPRGEAFRMLVVALAIHTFLACYFTLRLLRRFFDMGFPVAAFAAAAFAYSVPMIQSHAGFPMFVFSASVLPWVAYAALDFGERPGVRRGILAALPVVMAFLGGYVPLGAAVLGFALVLVGLQIILREDEQAAPPDRMQVFTTALVPFVIGTIVVGPYLWSVYEFVKASPSGGRSSLFFSAHELAERPQTLLRLLSFRYPVPGPQTEFSLTWGFIGVAIFALFLTCLRDPETLSRRRWTFVKVSAAVYFAVALAIFGQFSVVSDLLYYFLPQVGKMHIYQRLLLPAQFFFAVLLAIMLEAIVRVRPTWALRIAFAVFALATLLAASLVSRHEVLAVGLGLNNYIVYELLLATLAMAALLVPGATFATASVGLLFMLPALDQMYDYSQGPWLPDARRSQHGVALDGEARTSFVRYLQRFSDKDLIRYADITPRWLPTGAETFPKEFPGFVRDEVPLSSFMGFNYYLATRSDYMASMPFLADQRLHPPWPELKRAGIDFAIGLESDVEFFRTLGGLPEEMHRLPHGAVAVPLRSVVSAGRAFDNGYLRVFRGPDPGMALFAGGNIARGRPARQSSEGGGAADRAVDGDVDGRFEHGSVTHTASESAPWLEIDLGRAVPIAAVRIWNREEVGERLRDFLLTIADRSVTDGAAAGPAEHTFRVPFPPRRSSVVETAGATGRYVRIQLADRAVTPDSVLSLAEVEVFPVVEPASTPPRDVVVHDFEANQANHLRLDVESDAGARVQYLLFRNPGLRFFIDGQAVEPEDDGGLPAVTLPAGRHAFEVRYRHRKLTLFWMIYGLFGLAFVWSALTAGVATLRGEEWR